MNLLPRLKNLRWVALPLAFGGVVYLGGLVYFFPYDRVKDQIIATAASQNFDVEIEDVGPAFGTGLSFAGIEVTPKGPDGKRRSTIKVDRATVLTSILAGLRDEQAYDVDAELFQGQLEADVNMGPKASRYDLKGQGLVLADMAPLKDAVSVPAVGTLEFAVKLDVPNNRYAESGGAISWTCAACALGDGKAKLKIANNPLMAEGITLPRIRLGDFVGTVKVEKGVGKFQGVQAKSPDLEAFIEGEIRLSEPVASSYLDAYVRFKFSDAILKKEDRLGILLQIAEMMGKRPDGFYGFRLSGPLRYLRPPEWMKTSPFGGSGPTAAPGRGGSKLPRPTPPRPAPAAPPPPPPPAANEDDTVDPTDPNANLPRYPTLPPPD